MVRLFPDRIEDETDSKEHRIQVCLNGNEDGSVDLTVLRHLASSRGGLGSNSNAFRGQAWPKLVAAHRILYQDDILTSPSCDDNELTMLSVTPPPSAKELRRWVQKARWRRYRAPDEPDMEADHGLPNLLMLDPESSTGTSTPNGGSLSMSVSPARTASSTNKKTHRRQVSFLDDVQAKQEQHILYKLSQHLQQRYPHQSIDYSSIADLIMVLLRVLESPSITSITSLALVPQYWQRLEQEEACFASVLQECGDVELLQHFQDLLGTALPLHIRDSWIPYWMSRDLSDFNHITRVWDVLLSLPPGKGILQFSAALVEHYRETLLAATQPPILNAILQQISRQVDAEMLEILLARTLDIPSFAEVDSLATTAPTDLHLLDTLRHRREQVGSFSRSAADPIIEDPTDATEDTLMTSTPPTSTYSSTLQSIQWQLQQEGQRRRSLAKKLKQSREAEESSSSAGGAGTTAMAESSTSRSILPSTPSDRLLTEASKTPQMPSWMEDRSSADIDDSTQWFLASSSRGSHTISTPEATPCSTPESLDRATGKALSSSTKDDSTGPKSSMVSFPLVRSFVKLHWKILVAVATLSFLLLVVSSWILVHGGNETDVRTRLTHNTTRWIEEANSAPQVSLPDPIDDQVDELLVIHEMLQPSAVTADEQIFPPNEEEESSLDSPDETDESPPQIYVDQEDSTDVTLSSKEDELIAIVSKNTDKNSPFSRFRDKCAPHIKRFLDAARTSALQTINASKIGAGAGAEKSYLWLLMGTNATLNGSATGVRRMSRILGHVSISAGHRLQRGLKGIDQGSKAVGRTAIKSGRKALHVSARAAHSLLQRLDSSQKLTRRKVKHNVVAVRQVGTKVVTSSLERARRATKTAIVLANGAAKDGTALLVTSGEKASHKIHKAYRVAFSGTKAFGGMIGSQTLNSLRSIRGGSCVVATGIHHGCQASWKALQDTSQKGGKTIHVVSQHVAGASLIGVNSTLNGIGAGIRQGIEMTGNGVRSSKHLVTSSSRVLQSSTQSAIRHIRRPVHDASRIIVDTVGKAGAATASGATVIGKSFQKGMANTARLSRQTNDFARLATRRVALNLSTGAGTMARGASRFSIGSLRAMKRQRQRVATILASTYAFLIEKSLSSVAQTRSLGSESKKTWEELKARRNKLSYRYSQASRRVLSDLEMHAQHSRRSFQTFCLRLLRTGQRSMDLIGEGALHIGDICETTLAALPGKHLIVEGALHIADLAEAVLASIIQSAKSLLFGAIVATSKSKDVLFGSQKRLARSLSESAASFVAASHHGKSLAADTTSALLGKTKSILAELDIDTVKTLQDATSTPHMDEQLAGESRRALITTTVQIKDRLLKGLMRRGQHMQTGTVALGNNSPYTRILRSQSARRTIEGSEIAVEP